MPGRSCRGVSLSAPSVLTWSCSPPSPRGCTTSPGPGCTPTSRLVAASAESMGWVAEWVYRVSTTALATVCMTRQTSLDEITLDDLAVVRADIAAAVAVLPRCRATQRGLLHSLHTVCYQLGVVDEPPEHGNARHTSLEQRMAIVPQPVVREGSFATCASSRRPCGLRRWSPAPPAWPCSGPGSASIILRSAL